MKHPDFMAAHQKVEEASDTLHQEPQTLREVKHLHFAEYKIKGEELMKKARRLEAANGEFQHCGSLRLINEMCERKIPKERQVAGNSPEERVTT